MAVHADNYIFLEFLRIINTSRWCEVKERVDPLTKYDDSEFHTQFCLSKLTVHHLLSDVCQTVHLPFFKTLYDLYTVKITVNHYNYEWHFNGVLQAPRPAAYRPAPTSPRRLIFTFSWSNPNIAIILRYKWNTKSIFFAKCVTSI